MTEEYYRKRAEEYEEIYRRDDPIRQAELAAIGDAIRHVFKGKRVLEVACGTGYWTQILSDSAAHIIATDIAPEMLEIAKRKNYSCPVSFEPADAFVLPEHMRDFGGALANFWFSHVPKEQLESFLQRLHTALADLGIVFMADNVFVPGVGGELVTREGDENTYKLRRLRDGSEHLVLKNYYTRAELYRTFGRYSSSLREQDIVIGQCYWFLGYTPDRS